MVRAGWARRGNMSMSLGEIVKLRGGYASQDKDFESGAGEIGRQRLSSRGYSTTNNDFNIDADVTVFPWLPIRYGIRQQDTETESLRGSYSSFQSGKSEIQNRDFSVLFNRNPYPNLGFAYIGYKISTHITANLHLGLSYRHDRVEEGRDFLSVASALTIRGEIE